MGKMETLVALLLYFIIGFRLGAFITYVQWDSLNLTRLELNELDYILFGVALIPLVITLIGDEKK